MTNSRVWRRRLYRLIIPFGDPRRVARAISQTARYIKTWFMYSRLSGAEPLRFLDAQPELHDRTIQTPFDAHYFYMSGWAARQIAAHAPQRHVDVGSLVLFANLLAAWIPVIFIDFRPLAAKLASLQPIAAAATALPFKDNSVNSLSCLHVAEHVGLGRYGDPLDSRGTIKTATELSRVLAPGGRLYFAVPIGMHRVMFNAHRIHTATMIRAYFESLNLIEFSVVTDTGDLRERVPLAEFDTADYACGLFVFSKSAGEAL